MIQPQTQMLDFYRAGMKTAADIARVSLENAEKLQSRQLQIVRSALEDSTRSASDLAQVKSLEEMMALQTRLAGSQMERMMEFWSSLWRVGGESAAGAAHMATSQLPSVGERRPEQQQQHRKSA
ncbi:MAG TPA: phasin family protein [Burkholderiales bacterium]|nr:phasin family protein [Burkholderiales bacterium]